MKLGNDLESLMYLHIVPFPYRDVVMLVLDLVYRGSKVGIYLSERKGNHTPSPHFPVISFPIQGPRGSGESWRGESVWRGGSWGSPCFVRGTFGIIKLGEGAMAHVFVTVAESGLPSSRLHHRNSGFPLPQPSPISPHIPPDSRWAGIPRHFFLLLGRRWVDGWEESCSSSSLISACYPGVSGPPFVPFVHGNRAKGGVPIRSASSAFRGLSPRSLSDFGPGRWLGGNSGGIQLGWDDMLESAVDRQTGLTGLTGYSSWKASNIRHVDDRVQVHTRHQLLVLSSSVTTDQQEMW